MMQWNDLSLNDKAIVDEMLAKHTTNLSDYNFTNLWMWHGKRNYQIALVESFLCIRFKKNGQICHLYPIGSGSRKFLVELLASQSQAFQMRAIPEDGIEELSNPLWSITPEFDHFDYIYSFEDLLHLAGNHNQAKRNLIHQFSRNYKFKYCSITKDLIPKILEMETQWFTHHQNKTSQLAEEHAACLRALEFFINLQVIGGALLVEDQIAAYTVAEYINPQMILIHIEKALHEYKGSYAMISQQLLQHVSPTLYVNREEDLGASNLAKGKRSYHPLRMEKKFQLLSNKRF